MNQKQLRTVRKALASFVTAALLITAPGLPCYQATAAQINLKGNIGSVKPIGTTGLSVSAIAGTQLNMGLSNKMTSDMIGVDLTGTSLKIQNPAVVAETIGDSMISRALPDSSVESQVNGAAVQGKTVSNPASKSSIKNVAKTAVQFLGKKEKKGAPIIDFDGSGIRRSVVFADEGVDASGFKAAGFKTETLSQSTIGREKTGRLQRYMGSIPSFSSGGPNKVGQMLGALKDRLKQKTTRVVIAGVIGLMLVGGLTYRHEAVRDTVIPVALSEIRQMEKDAERTGVPIGPIARYYAKTNDLLMNVFIANNYAASVYTTRMDVERFARELEVLVSPDLQIHYYNIPSLAKQVPQEAALALERLKPLKKTGDEMDGVNQEFNATWQDFHTDVTRTEYYWVEIKDSKGDVVDRKRESREVYDHTNHSYIYHKAHGEAASTGLDRALRDNEDSIQVKEKMPVAAHTNADGEYAAGIRHQGERLSPEEATRLASLWNHGSNLEQNKSAILSLWQALHKDAGAWRGAKQTAHDHFYPTKSQSDPGPGEFRVAKKALGDGTALTANIDEIISGIEYSKAMAPILEAKIRQFIAMELDHSKQGNPKKLAKEIVQISKKMYASNFKGGLSVYNFRAGLVVLLSLLGAVGAGALAVGVEYLLQRRRQN